MSAHCNTRSYSPLKAILGKIGDLYQAYCTTYKTHAMATYHGGAGCLLNRGLNILTEDTEHADIDNDSTHSSDARVTLGDPEAVEHPEDPAYENQDRLAALMREINDLHQRIAAREGQPVEPLDHTQQELQNLSTTIHQPQPPASTEPFGEVLHQYMDTLFSSQKQSILTNSSMQDVPIFNDNDSTKLEDWLLEIETTVDLPARLAKAKS